MNRSTASILALAFASTAVAARADPFLNWLRQTHYDSAVVWDVPIDLHGTMQSPLGVGERGSLYELWAVETSSNSLIEMDREFVSHYAPQIALSAETGDPYKAAARTRVDQPFTIRLNVSGMDLSLRTELRTLNLVHQGFLFPTQEYSLDDLGGLNEPQLIQQFSITDNGEHVFQYPMTNLTGGDLTKLFGAEVLAITSPDRYNRGHGNNADHVDGDHGSLPKRLDIILQDEVVQNRYVAGNIFEWTIVQVWPIAEASIEGLNPNVVYHEVPLFSINLVDLYPDSTTYLRVYQGPPDPNPAAPIEIGTAAVIVRDATPQDRTIEVTKLDEYLPEEGSYTLEVMHETPFGVDILARFSPLQVNWDIDFRGNINSIE